MSKINYLRYFNIEPEYKGKVLVFYAYSSVRIHIARIGAILSAASLISFVIAWIIGFARFSRFESVTLVIFSGWFGAFIFVPFFVRIFVIPIISWFLSPYWVREIAICYEFFAYVSFILICFASLSIPWGFLA